LPTDSLEVTTPNPLARAPATLMRWRKPRARPDSGESLGLILDTNFVIAAALANGFGVVTSNDGEFRRVPGLEVETY